jgi:hypothetical protein
MTRSRDLMRRALALYDAAPRADRLFVRARAFLSDLPQIERHAPRDGAILDLGCGHGRPQPREYPLPGGRRDHL